MTIAPTLTLSAANDTDVAPEATIAITGLIGLLARSQARRIAEAARPANVASAPSSRSVQP
ncbi:hypothetical protein [Tateyamaria sp. syn59]|uniref:hypothetical protein n=1 Tax=Tateyamaria sp. syn59 TaxID=2576942 RepID=UPI0011BE1C96|nr:hypothetical protein [Tateyamaria sp. syn59]